jgi:type I restriction-modification system DNA methylase subunit
VVERQPDQVQALQDLDFGDVFKGRRSGAEENLKNIVVRPVLELLGFTDPKDVDYEYKVKSGRPDIALLVNGKPKVFVECKSPEQKLLDHVQRALEYAHERQVGYVLLTNGHEFRLYRSFIENVIDPRDRELLRVELRKLTEQLPELQKWISKESLTSEAIDKIARERVERIKEKVTAPALIAHLRMSKALLAENAKREIEALYSKHDGFSRAVEKWAEASRLDLEKDEWRDKLAQEIAYSFVNRLYFYKIAEDRGIVKPKLKPKQIRTLEESFSLADIVRLAFEEIIRIDYRAIFEDQTGILTRYVEFDDDVLKKVIYPLIEYNYAAIDQDIIGRVYQEHISREERKKLGQFYTPEWIVDFIIGRMPITVESKILDPVCGSGRFLTRVYDVLRQEYSRKGFSEDSIHSLILQNNLFGFDINPFAVQLTAMSLALKDLNHKTNTINVLETDSLASNLEEWMEGQLGSVDETGKRGTRSAFPDKFAIVVGNPPYFVSDPAEIRRKYGKTYKEMCVGKTNIASLFLVASANLLEEDGYLGFVFPKSVLYVEPWKSIRRFILSNFQIKEIYDLREAFEGVLLEEIVLILKKTRKVRSDAKVNVVYKYWAQGNQRPEARHLVPYSEFTEDLFPIYLNEANRSIKEKMQRNSLPLGTVARLTRGLGLVRSEGLIKNERTSLLERPTLAGKDIQRYTVRGQKYVNTESPKLDKIAKGKVHELSREKLMFQGIIGQSRNYLKLSGTYDPKGEFLDLDTVVNVLIEDKEFDPLYVLAVLNSRLGAYYLNNMVFCHSVRTMHFEYAKHIPIRKATPEQQKSIGKLASRLLKAHKELTDLRKEMTPMPQFEPRFIELKEREGAMLRELDTIDREIDNAVFDLYGLNKTEVSTVLAESFDYLPEPEA